MSRLAVLLVIPFLIAAIEKAWWIDYTYEPKLEASKYGSDFSAVEIYSCDDNRYFTNQQCAEIAVNKGKFSALRDLNNDGVQELWYVGVAKYKSGKPPYANIVIVSDPNTKEIQQVLTVATNEPGFAVFFGETDELLLFFCMECGNYIDIQWRNNQWALIWPEPYG